MSRQRPAPRRRAQPGRQIPYLWIGTGLIVVIVVGALIFASRQGGSSTASAAPVECNRNEHFVSHIHSNLRIHINGQVVPVPAQVGIRSDCLFWLHTHDAAGTLHVEAPIRRTFTLGEFFKVWEKSLSPTELIGYQVDDSHQIKAYVNGKEWAGDPAQIPLESRSLITLEYGPPFLGPHTHQFAPNE